MPAIKQCDVDVISSLRERLAGGDFPPKRVLVGFDGYVDTIYRAVSGHTPDGQPKYFQTIKQYAQRLAQAAGKSADIEIQQQDRRFGGNAPLMADGCAALEDDVTLIGELGYPHMDDVFRQLHPSLQSLSIGAPCQTIALEFTDGKIMMGDMVGAPYISWENIRQLVGAEQLRTQITQADLIAVLNWSAHPNTADIARHIAEFAREKRPLMFFDLSDPGALSREELKGYLQTIADIGQQLPVVLGMNENEARVVLGCLFPDMDPAMSMQALAQQYGHQMVQSLHLTGLTIHAVAYTLGFDGSNIWQADGFHVERPLLSTGGGDHYNAAFCHALAHGCTMPECLIMACAASSFYVQTGRSATHDDLKKMLLNRKEK